MAKKHGFLEIFTEEGTPINIKNTLLLDHIVWDFFWNFQDADDEDRVVATFPKFKDRPEVDFTIEKVSSTEFKVELKRRNIEDDVTPDDGYFLEFIFTVFGYNGPVKRRIMDFENDAVSVVYNYDNLCEMQKKSIYWILKCVIKMHEINILQNDARSQQEELILNFANKEKYREKLEDMAYVMKRESLKDIFSGRQKYEFAVVKAGLLERSLIFADDLAAKMKAKENKTEYRTRTYLGVYLNYILANSFRCIDKYTTLKLYIMAHNYGLPYLADECADFMLSNLDYNYIVHVLVYADMAQDIPVFNSALDVFLTYRRQVMKTTAWETLAKNSRISAQNIIDSSIRKVRYEIKRKLEKQNEESEHQESVGNEAQNANDNADPNTAENSRNVIEDESGSNTNSTEAKDLPTENPDVV